MSKERAFGAVLTLLLMSFVILAFNIQPAKTGGNIYNRVDGDIDSSNILVQRDGDFYRVTSCLTGKSTSSSKNVSEYITVNTTWTLGSSPYIVEGDVIVEPNVFLTIEPGVVVKFTNGTNLIIDGGLIAQGNPANKITFTSNASVPAIGDWSGVKFRNSALDNASLIDWVVVVYADKGISLESTTQFVLHSTFMFNNYGIFSAGSAVGFNSTFESNNVGGYSESDATELYEDSVFVNNTVGFIIRKSYLSKIVFKNCTFLENESNGIQVDWSGRVEFLNSLASHNGNDGINGATIGIDELYIHESQLSDNGGYGINSPFGSSTVGKNWTVANSEIMNNSHGGIHEFGAYPKPIIILDSKISNNSGDGIYGETFQYALISYSQISNNTGSGVQGGTMTITDSIISNNGKNGIEGSLVDIEKSMVTRNNETGILVSGGSVHLTHIYNNLAFNLKNTGSNTINATHNWWGSTNETLIDGYIYDYYDDYNLGKIFYKPFLPSPYFIPIEGEIFCVDISSNSTIKNFNFNQLGKYVSFDVAGPNQTIGFSNITIPKELFWGDFSVYKDNSILVEGVDYSKTFNGTHYIFNITYVHSTHTIKIIATEVIPEFPSLLILPTFMLTTLATVVLWKRKRLKFS